ncbi:MAM and LDL-receptor class A domain-containing protein 2, partial [Araneus ventricosus]
IRFIGVKGYNGDLALDDIFIQQDTCDEPTTTVPPPTEFQGQPCDFEAADICGFKLESPDGIAWKRTQGKSIKGNVEGPKTDKSYGTSEGHYMIVRPTTGARTVGDNKAYVVMPNVPSTGVYRSCVRFWYQMYGDNVISLNLYMRTQGGSLPPFSLWSHGTKHGDNTWRVGQRTIDAPYTHEKKADIEDCKKNFRIWNYGLVTVELQKDSNLCTEMKYFCMDRKKDPCLSREQICNGKKECSDGSDESLCDRCPPNFCLNGGECSVVNHVPVCKCKDKFAQNRCKTKRVVPEKQEKPEIPPKGAGVEWIIGVVIGTVLLIAIMLVIWYKRNTNAERARLPHAVDNPVYGLNLDTLTFGELNSHMPVRTEDVSTLIVSNQFFVSIISNTTKYVLHPRYSLILILKFVELRLTP